jgi:hypothetical protein
MSLRRPHRFVALFALALALLAALPCSMLAGESCCGAASPCGDAGESPCARLAATPCCEADGAPLDASFAPQLPTPGEISAHLDFGGTAIVCGAVSPFRSRAPIRDSISIRTIVLQL